MATFSVTVIRKDRERDYISLLLGKESAVSDGLHVESVFFTELIEAETKKEAEAIAKKKYPGNRIDAAATHLVE